MVNGVIWNLNTFIWNITTEKKLILLSVMNRICDISLELDILYP